MGSSDKGFEKQVAGYGLTTAHILYRRPDHHWLLQSYVWQAYDMFPQFPELQRFLAFWQEKLEGPCIRCRSRIASSSSRRSCARSAAFSSCTD